MANFGALPWEVNPVFQQRVLAAVAQWIADVRGSIADELDEEAGDLHFGGWVPGTAFHARFANRVGREALSGDHPWLRILDGTRQFTFAIGSVPVRVFRGTPSSPSARSRKPGPAERAAQVEGFELDEVLGCDLEWVWRFVVEVNPTNHRVERVSFCEIHVGEQIEVRSCYEIPLQPNTSAVASLSDARPAGAEVSPAAVELREETSEEARTNSSGE